MLYVIAGAGLLLVGSVAFYKLKIRSIEKKHQKEKEMLEKEKQLLVEATNEYSSNMNKYVSKLEELRRKYEKDAEILRIDDDATRIAALYDRVRELTEQAKSDNNNS